ncbi:MAG: winged helix-turn-helix transcriptional regulator [Phycisphaerales bacterium]
MSPLSRPSDETEPRPTRRGPTAEPLGGLTRRRWSIPILAHSAPTGHTRFAVLLAALGPSRETLSATLVDLVAQGWLARATGFGHPLRPEYLLTPAGLRIAPRCRRIMLEIDRLGITEAALRKWSLPILLVISDPVAAESRFNALRAALPAITVRALALALKDLCSADLVDRVVDDSYPPVPRYTLTRRARRLAAAARALDREVGLRVVRPVPTDRAAPRPPIAPPDPRVEHAKQSAQAAITRSPR